MAGFDAGTDTVGAVTVTLGDAVAVFEAVLAALALGANGCARAQPSVIAMKRAMRAATPHAAGVAEILVIGDACMMDSLRCWRV